MRMSYMDAPFSELRTPENKDITRGVMIPFFTGIRIGITTKGVGIGIAWNRLFVGIDSKLESTQFQNGVGIGITVFHKMPKI